MSEASHGGLFVLEDHKTKVWNTFLTVGKVPALSDSLIVDANVHHLKDEKKSSNHETSENSLSFDDFYFRNQEFIESSFDSG